MNIVVAAGEDRSMQKKMVITATQIWLLHVCQSRRRDSYVCEMIQTAGHQHIKISRMQDMLRAQMLSKQPQIRNEPEVESVQLVHKQHPRGACLVAGQMTQP